ncbi:MAG: MBL fold metallo-hydrolase [Thermodesulfobacteriota bacterium]
MESLKTNPAEKRFGPILFVRGQNQGRYPNCHSLYLEAGTRVIIDPASDRERLAALRDGPGVDAAWLTHYHEDHFMHLDLFRDQELWMSAEDAPVLESLEALFEYYGLTGERERTYWTPVMKEMFNFLPRRTDRFLAEGEKLNLGGLMVEVLATPGHTRGHLSFYFPEEGVLFLGDYDLTPFGPWYGDVGSSLEETIVSVNRLRRRPARVWLSSHEQGLFEFEPGDLWDRYLSVIGEREARLLEFLREPRTMGQIVEARLVYGRKREPPEYFDFAEKAIMGKHLERLIGRGEVVRAGDLYRPA